MKVSFQDLLLEKEKNNGTIVFSENGKIVKYTAKQYKAKYGKVDKK